MNSFGKRVVFNISRLFPALVVRYAYAQLSNPQVSKLREHELEVLDQAQKNTFPFMGFDICTYHWPGEGQAILLIHGWEGQAGNFADLVLRLRKSGYAIYAFDGPSHGFSSKGKASLFEFTKLVGVLIEKFQVKKLVSHSFGGVATTYALYNNQSLHIDRYVLLTTPDRFTERIDQVANVVGIAPVAVKMLTSKIEKEYDIKANELNVSDFVQKINVNRSLIIHDENDRIIPLEQSRRVAENWQQCTLEEVTDTGHFRILRTESVLDRVLEFLNEDS